MTDEQPKRLRGQRGPGKKPRMVHVTLRLPPHVVERFSTGGTLSQNIRDALTMLTEGVTCEQKESS